MYFNPLRKYPEYAVRSTSILLNIWFCYIHTFAESRTVHETVDRVQTEGKVCARRGRGLGETVVKSDIRRLATITGVSQIKQTNSENYIVAH